MATITNTRSLGAGFGTWVRDFRRDLRTEFERRRVFNETYEQLNQLSDRDLEDIGVSRLQIGDIARDAAYGR